MRYLQNTCDRFKEEPIFNPFGRGSAPHGTIRKTNVFRKMAAMKTAFMANLEQCKFFARWRLMTRPGSEPEDFRAEESDYIIRYALLCHPGKVRRMNQDNYLCAGKIRSLKCQATPTEVGVVKPGEHAVFGVFDGLGGEERGEKAALIAAETASEMLHGGEKSDDLFAFCITASRRIASYSENNEIGRMGTTAAILSFTRNIISLCNVGDSRIYRYYNDTLTQLSVDHSLPIAPGAKGPLTQALGSNAPEGNLEPYLAHGKPVPGELYLICSDGLTDLLQDKEISAVLKSQTLKNAVDELYSAAMEHGGKDNITILLCQTEKAK